MGAGTAGKSSETITAEALVVRAAAAYLGLETKVSSPGPACSIPLRPVISVSGEPFSRRRSSAAAMADSFMTKKSDAPQSYTRLLRLPHFSPRFLQREVGPWTCVAAAYCTVR